MDPNVDRGMWAVVVLIAAILIGGVVLIAYPRINGKISNEMGKTVDKGFTGFEPTLDRDVGEKLTVVYVPLETKIDINKYFRKGTELTASKYVGRKETVSRDVATTQIIDVRDAKMVKLYQTKIMKRNDKNNFDIKLKSVKQNGLFVSDLTVNDVPLMQQNRAYSLKGVDFLVIEIPEADAENWTIIFSTEKYQASPNLVSSLNGEKTEYRDYVKISEFAGETGDILKITNHKSATSPFHVLKPRPIKKGETYTISAKFFVPEESNKGTRSDVPMITMYNTKEDANGISQNNHRSTSAIRFKDRWVEVSHTHTFEKNEPMISFMSYGAYYAGDVAYMKDVKIEKSEYKTPFNGYGK